MISELIKSNRSILHFLESQQMQQVTPAKEEMMLGNADDAIQRYKALSKQKRQVKKRM